MTSGLERINESSIHVDFMIGAPDVEAYGRTTGGDEVPVLIDGRWKV